MFSRLACRGAILAVAASFGARLGLAVAIVPRSFGVALHSPHPLPRHQLRLLFASARRRNMAQDALAVLRAATSRWRRSRFGPDLAALVRVRRRNAGRRAAAPGAGEATIAGS